LAPPLRFRFRFRSSTPLLSSLSLHLLPFRFFICTE
jgi:hypothetical protein